MEPVPAGHEEINEKSGALPCEKELIEKSSMHFAVDEKCRSSVIHGLPRKVVE